MANRVIGLDLGQHNLALVELEVGYRRWLLAGATLIPLPEDDNDSDAQETPGEASSEEHSDFSEEPTPTGPASASEDAEGAPVVDPRQEEKRRQAERYARRVQRALAPLIADGRLQADALHTQLAAQDAYLERLDLPFSQRRQIQPLLLPQLDGRFPVETEELHLDFTVGAEHGENHQVFASGIEPELLHQRIDMLKACEAEPKLIDLAPFPLATAYNAFYAGTPETAAVVDIGSETTNVLVLRHGKVDYVRSFTGGGEDLTRALAESYDLPLDRARDGKHQEGFLETSGNDRELTAEEAEIARTLRDALTPLLRQLRRSLSAHASRSVAPVERIYLVGASASLPGLREWLETGLGVATVVPGPDQGVGLWDQLGEHAPRLMTAMGLALRGSTQVQSSQFNFRHGAFAYRGGRAWLTERVPALGGWAGALAALLMLLLIGNIVQVRAESRALDRALEASTTELFGTPILSPDRVIARLGQPAAGQDFLPRLTAWSVFETIASQVGELQEDGYSIEARAVEVDMQRRLVDIRGVAESAESVEALEDRLSAMPCLRNVTRNALARSRDGEGFDFNLNGIASCAPPGEDP